MCAAIRAFPKGILCAVVMTNEANNCDKGQIVDPRQPVKTAVSRGSSATEILPEVRIAHTHQLACATNMHKVAHHTVCGANVSTCVPILQDMLHVACTELRAYVAAHMGCVSSTPRPYSNSAVLLFRGYHVC